MWADMKELSKEEQMEIKYGHMTKMVERRMPGVRDPIIKKIHEHFGIVIFRRCSAPADFSERVFKDCFGGKKVKTILEIGTLNGITASVLTQYAEKVITMDIIDYAMKYEIWDKLGVSDKIEFRMVENELQKAKMISNMKFEFCYMDGDHLHHTWSDFMMVKKCGRVLLHEAILDGSQPNLLANSLPPEEIRFFNYGKKTSSLAYWSKE